MLGSFFGSLIGDCLAAYLKDQETKISEEKMKLLMKMPGGGDNKNLAGQFSDYSEMTVQLTSSLLIYDKEVSLKSQIASITTLIAFGHLIWLKT